MTSCSSKDDFSINNNFGIPQLRYYYEPILKEAQIWSPDAYLVDVDIPIGVKRPWLLSAYFFSPTKSKESLEVLLDSEGKLSERKFSHVMEILQEDPILPSQWKIDSQDALDILVEENIDSINKITELCGSLTLSREAILENRPLVWGLTYYQCGLPTGNYSFLDPLTEKIITH